jgi:hypothetical protein
MKLNLFTSTLMFTFALSTGTVISCNSGNKGSSNAESTARTIKDEKLYPFLLGGIYFMHGYNGADAVMTQIKASTSEKPGSSAFNNDLQKAYDELMIFPFKKEQGSDAKSTLAEWWDIHTKEDFVKTQEDLLQSGHQEAYATCRKALDENGGAQADVSKIDLKKYKIDKDATERLKFVKDNYSKFSTAGIKAWDLARYTNNTAMGYAAGYVSEDEAYAMLNKAVPVAKQQYDNWAAYYDDWNLGRHFWNGDNSESFDADVKAIKDTTNPYNIYGYMPVK